MDRQLGPEIIRKRRLRRLAAGAPVAVVAIGAFLLLPGWLRPSLARAGVLTAKVERGIVEATIEASGTVLPAHEKVLSSPIDTRVVRILKRPGDSVHQGDALLELDTEATRLDLSRLEDRLSQKRNEQTQVRLELERNVDELRGRIETADLDRQILAARHERNVRMSANGLISDELVKESEVQAQKAEIELAQLRRSVESAQQASDAQIEGLRLDLTILQKEAEEARHRLNLATTRAEADGVLTWIVRDEGASVQRGDVLARVARLDAFRVEATISDVHAGRLAPGLPAKVRLSGKSLAGVISSVYPQIENGALRFTVDLEDASNAALRQSLRVDVLAVTGSRDGVLRLRRGPFAQAGGAVQDVFVVEDDQAVRRRVSLGLSGLDFFEVTDGLAEGDEVIVSDMSDYAHMKQIGLR